VARLPRLAVAGLPHLVVHRSLSGRSVFVDDEDRAVYRHALGLAAREAGVALHAYGLDAGEVRLLATPDSAAALGTMMQSVGRRYVRAFNLRHRRNGTPWDGRFRSTVVELEGRFLACLRFVELGDADAIPVLSGDERSAGTSLPHHLGGRADPLVTEHGAYWALGNTPFEREAVYRRYLDRPAESGALQRIRDATLKGWALGSNGFVAGLAGVTSRRTQPLKRGRPSRGATESAKPAI